MKHYEVEHHGLSYTVQLHPDTAEAIGAEPVVKDKAPNQKKKVSRGTRKSVSRETPSEPDTPGSEVETEE
jgi:hypothetical protein